MSLSRSLRKPLNNSACEKNIRAIGIDDGFFKQKQTRSTRIVAVLMRVDSRIEGILFSDAAVDGLDSTQKIVEMLSSNRRKFIGQAKAIFLSGINFAGFNIVDTNELYSVLKVPIIVVFRKRPRMQKIAGALKHFNDFEIRAQLIKNAGRIYKAEKIFFQCKGIKPKEASTLIKLFSLHSNLPEPVRIAHLVASASTLGRSTSP
ncbi:MAG: DUF99 family protein [Candidatus Diapherotrites archaeon]|nr:DUF99 family protein [Candidatus Diapherotrites archaeon]